MAQSRYDELHDRYFALASTKAGTRYERLAAVVFACLDDTNTVIHDVSLIGSSEVRHQIDVAVEMNGKKRRVLIETKDFDKRGKRVGLSIIRDFRSVIEDVKPDDAFVITCTGYTAPARRYAKAKGIKLAVLRAFEEADWEEYIRAVRVQMHMLSGPTLTGIDVRLDPAATKVLGDEMRACGIGRIFDGGGVQFSKSDPVFLVANDEKEQICTFVERTIASHATDSSPVNVDLDPKEWQLSINDKIIPFTKFAFTGFVPPIVTTEFEVTSKRIAELILKGFGEHDFIVYADQIQGAMFHPGQTRPSPAGDASSSVV
jgi:hypothetical protein